ncbi:MAG: helix-turn-helix domain-containing protein [Chloroflexaceae bacterium]|nr:helix-turn-helix domain-containing protein [Chloroflexaceae bacterium]
MLERILNELRTCDVPLSLTYLSKRLELEPTTLEGMLQTLERKGRVSRVSDACRPGQCWSCPLSALCPPESRWMLTTPPQSPVPAAHPEG